MKKNYKLVISVIVLIIGLCAVGYAIHGMNEIKQARGDVDKLSGLFPKNIVSDSASKIAHNKIDSYVTPVWILFFGGIAFVVGGGCGIYRYKKRR